MVIIKNEKGFAHLLPILLVILAIAITVGVAKVVINKNQQNQAIKTEKTLYDNLDKQSASYIDKIAQKYSGKKEHSTSCSYSSTEGGRGALGCLVSSSVSYEASSVRSSEVISWADSELESLPWGNPHDDTASTKKYSKTVIKNVIYRQSQNVSCGVTYYETEVDLLINASCGGNALAEYYPVKDN